MPSTVPKKEHALAATTTTPLSAAKNKRPIGRMAADGLEGMPRATAAPDGALRLGDDSEKIPSTGGVGNDEYNTELQRAIAGVDTPQTSSQVHFTHMQCCAEAAREKKEKKKHKKTKVATFDWLTVLLL